MARTISAVVRHVLFAATLLGVAGQQTTGEYYYAIEVNGVLIGYSKLATAPLSQGQRALTALTHEVVVRGTLLGAKVDNRILLTYHIDPATNAFTYHDSRIEQGSTVLTSTVRIEGQTARVSDGRGGPESTVDLPADVVLANTLVQSHLLADFVAGRAEQKAYRLFDGRDNAVREVSYTKTGSETLQLAGRLFDTFVLGVVDRSTGVNMTVWLDTKTGIVVQTRQAGNARSYLTGPSVVETVTQAGIRANLDPSVLSKTNASISNVRRISSMKVRVVAQPSGLWLTPEALNVPGQRFTGSVKDNLVDGVFEVEHKRYDGTTAPPFPPDFGRDPALARWLAADDYIQADDPVLREKAREITRGARDSWEAARRLSAWVATEIKGAIPGGVTARGTFDQRAGECGGHSFLMAAFSRSVGIPARAVWGCMYVPNDGGAFGQHAWNEVYMGEAGWIPLDTTAAETDYVDSGHIRIGVYKSVATTINMRTMEILDHRVAPGAAPVAAVGGIAGQDAGQPAARIDRLLSDSYPSTEPGAAVIVSKAGAIILEKGYGLADTERKAPVTPDTVFRLASVTKVFTGTAIVMLAQRGTLSLDDPVTKFLPSYPASGEAITVRHLLSHTSGVADYLDRPDSMEWATREHSVQALIKEISDRPASFAPGQKNSYSNSNYVLLGSIIERISGLSFADFVQTTLFKPLGMTSTSCGGAWNGVARLATAYEPARTVTDQLDWSRLLVARPYTMSSLYAAGGCVSSARDLARFHRSLLVGELIGKALLAWSFGPAALAGGRPGTMSSGGWQLDEVQGRRAAMRGGALPGVCTWFLTMPDEQVSVILLSNRTPGKPRCGMLAVQAAGIVSGG